MLAIADFPQLQLLCWNRKQDGLIDEKTAIRLYDRAWHFVDKAALLPKEREMIARLKQQFGATRVNV
jgi:hypothetical protein